MADFGRGGIEQTVKTFGVVVDMVESVNNHEVVFDSIGQRLSMAMWVGNRWG